MKLKKFKVGDRVEFLHDEVGYATDKWLNGTIAEAFSKEDGDILVRADKKIHDDETLDGHGWYEDDVNSIRLLKEQP